MNVILFDEPTTWQNLLPLTYTRPVSGIRVGILTIFEKWQRYFPGSEISCLTEEYLYEKFPLNTEEVNYFINASVIPNPDLVKCIAGMAPSEAISWEAHLIAFKGSMAEFDQAKQDFGFAINFNHNLTLIKQIPDIFLNNGEAISQDFNLITGGRRSEPISASVKVIGNIRELFIEPGAVVEATVFNTKNGPIYISKGAEIMEGCVIRGPFCLGEGAVVKMAAKIYGPTTVGPFCKVGGEINNSILFAYSNKAHDGFLGNSVIGEWCNLGADTNNSNLKNNYGHIKMFNYLQNAMTDTGLQFCGLVMGDHSKSGINTMFNTGTVVGVGSNVYGSGFPPKHVPSFIWGGEHNQEIYNPDKLIETAEIMFERRGLKFDAVEKALIKNVFKRTECFR